MPNRKSWPIRSTLIAALITAPGLALSAEDPGIKEPAQAVTEESVSPHTLTGNVGLFSQYIFRGLTQTNEDPAVQGGMDYAHSSGVYVGFWGSNISFLRENFTSATGVVGGQYSGGGSLELDLYGGYKGKFGESDFTYDVGGLYYFYPGDVTSGCVIGNQTCPDADTFEVYGALGWKWVSFKYSHSVGDTFGFPDADNTYYLDLSAAVPIAETGLTLGLHLGRQEYDGEIPGTTVEYDDFLSYTDYRVSLAYDLSKATDVLKGTEVGVMYTDTSGANACGYGRFDETGVAGGTPCVGVFPKNIADSHVTVWLKRTF
ncbi:MAG: TorF family putative porin [Burkholderiales bacterium]